MGKIFSRSNVLGGFTVASILYFFYILYTNIGNHLLTSLKGLGKIISTTGFILPFIASLLMLGVFSYLTYYSLHYLMHGFIDIVGVPWRRMLSAVNRIGLLKFVCGSVLLRFATPIFNRGLQLLGQFNPTFANSFKGFPGSVIMNKTYLILNHMSNIYGVVFIAMLTFILSNAWVANAKKLTIVRSNITEPLDNLLLIVPWFSIIIFLGYCLTLG